jgi:hypothetical protein
MQEAIEGEEYASEKVKEIHVPLFHHAESGLSLRLREMSLYLLNPEDFSLSSEEFDPAQHEHAIPKFEMARIYLMICALTGDHLGFSEDDREDPVFRIYQDAFRRALAVEEDADMRQRLVRVGLQSGFTLGL